MLAGARTPLLIVTNRVRPLRRPVPPPSRLPRPHRTLLDSRRPACAQNFLTAWVVMSLFVGVISIGMFEAFEAMKAPSNISLLQIDIKSLLFSCSTVRYLFSS